MRVYTQKSYDIPPEQVVGSSAVTKYQFATGGEPELLREPKVLFIDDGPGKAEAINLFIGRRPTFAFGNSDDDQLHTLVAAVLVWPTGLSALVTALAAYSARHY